VLDRAYQLAINGTPTQAKDAATFVAKVPDNEDQAGELVQVSTNWPDREISILQIIEASSHSRKSLRLCQLHLVHAWSLT
jgi:hypothetical protein